MFSSHSLTPLSLQDELKYSLVGTAEDRQYFYLNPDDGVLILRRSLVLSSISQFKVGSQPQSERPNVHKPIG